VPGVSQLETDAVLELKGLTVLKAPGEAIDGLNDAVSLGGRHMREAQGVFQHRDEERFCGVRGDDLARKPFRTSSGTRPM